MALALRCSQCGRAIPTPRNKSGSGCPFCLATLALTEKPASVPAQPVRERGAQRLGKFLLSAKLGSGGMGDVWKAWDTELERWVALKLLRHDDSRELDRFTREARTAAALTHPHIAAVYEAGEVGDRHYIAMELVVGRTLDQWPRKDLRGLVALVRDVAEAVGFAHKHGIVHRDLKPANLMATGEAEKPRAVVMDFGLARRIEGGAKLSRTGTLAGTPPYISPEQTRGKAADARSDVYSLGATLYELLTGRLPFQSEDLYELIREITDSEPASPRSLNRAIDRDLETIVLKCLEKEPSRRYVSAIALARDLDHWLKGEPILAHPVGAFTRFYRKLGKRKSLAVAVLGVATAAVFGALLIPRWTREGAVARAEPHVDLARTWMDQFVQLIRIDEDRQTDLEKLIQKARASLDQALQECPDHADALYEMGRLHSISNSRDQAIEYFGKSLEASPHLAKASLERAVARLFSYVDARQELIERIRPQHERGIGLHPGFDSSKNRTVVPPHVRDDEKAHRIRLLVEEDLARAKKWSSELSKLTYIDGLLLFAQQKYPEAAANLTNYLHQAPTDIDAWYFKGMALYIAGHFADADKAATRTLELVPRFAQALVLRGRIRMDLDDLAGALCDLDKMVKVVPNDEAAYFARGNCHREMKEYAKAVEDFSKVITLVPKRPGGYNNRGIVLAKLGKPEEAIRDYDKAIELRPDLTWAYDNRGLARTNQGDFQEAIKDFKRAIELDGTYFWAYMNRAVCWGKLKDFESAKRDFDKAIEINADYPGTYINRGEFRRRALGDYKGAEADFNKAIELNPEIQVAYFNRGLLLMDLQNPSGARDDFAKACKLNPRDPESLYMRGMANYSLKDYEKAIEDCSSALEQKPKFAWALHGRGLAKLAKGLSVEAIADFKLAIDADPEYSNPYKALGQLLGDLETRRDEAIVYLTKAIQLDPNDPATQFNWALAKSYKGLIDEAIQGYTRALELNPTMEMALVNRGNMHWTKNRIDEALEDFERAVKVNPSSPKAYLWRGSARIAKGLHDEAMKDLDRSLELDAKDYWTYFTRGKLRSILALSDEALEDFKAALKWAPPDWSDRKAVEERVRTRDVEMDFVEASRVFREKKYKEAVRRFIRIVERHPNTQQALKSAYNAACGYALMGDKNHALEWLEKSVKMGMSDAAQIEQDVDLDSLRGDPRYKKLVEGLKKAPSEN